MPPRDPDPLDLARFGLDPQTDPALDLFDAADDWRQVPIHIECTPEAWIVSTIEARWPGPDRAEPHLQPRVIVPRTDPDLIAPDPHERTELIAAIAYAQMARRRSFQRCAGCDALQAPEHGADLDERFFCHGCMSRDHGVVF